MKEITILMYTKGTGSGHLTRINAVYKGFKKSGLYFKFYACAYRSKYKSFLNSEITLLDKDEFPNNIDIFICDWKADQYIESIPESKAKIWIGLRRLGKIKSTFPSFYHIIAIEPNVIGEICIYPIINTYSDELKSREEIIELLNLDKEKLIALFCENGAYPKHVDAVFNTQLEEKYQVIKSSNSPFSKEKRDISYYPVAELFQAIDYLVIGGGYNSIHEAICYANLDNTKIINVGGDDQAYRIKKMKQWAKTDNSKAHVLAKYIYKLLKSKEEEEL